MTDNKPSDILQKPLSPRNYNYVSDYNSNAYYGQPAPLPGTTFANSQATRDGLYTISGTANTSYSPRGGAVSGGGSKVGELTRTRSEASNFVSSQVTNQ